MIDGLAGQLTEELAEQHERLGRAVTAIITEYAASLDSRKVTSTVRQLSWKKYSTSRFRSGE